MRDRLSILRLATYMMSKEVNLDWWFNERYLQNFSIHLRRHIRLESNITPGYILDDCDIVINCR
jgi:hypothetical protein